MLAYTMGILALVVFVYRFSFIMMPMLMKSTSYKQMFKSLTLLV